MKDGSELQTSTSTLSEESSSGNSVNDRSEDHSSGDLRFLNTSAPLIPTFYPVLVPGLSGAPNDQEQMNRGAGLYAVMVNPFTHLAEFQSSTLVPFTYNIPTQSSSTAMQTGEQPQEQQHAGPQRQVVVRRFQIAFHLEIFLILKLAAVIFLFNQDGSKQRLALLVFLASIIYLYQTGALAPVLRWLSQGMQREPAPPRPPVVPLVGAQLNENDIGEGNPQNDIARDGVEGETGNRWLEIVKEIRMFVFGFISSLLPNFHHRN